LEDLAAMAEGGSQNGAPTSNTDKGPRNKLRKDTTNEPCNTERSASYECLARTNNDWYACNREFYVYRQCMKQERQERQRNKDKRWWN